MEVDEDEGRWVDGIRGVEKGVHRLKFGVVGGRFHTRRVELPVSGMRLTQSAVQLGTAATIIEMELS